MYTVVETPLFLQYAAQVWSDGEREAFVDWIADNPEAGDVMPGTGGLRKVRWGRAGMGKRGGVRVIYFTRLPQGVVALVVVYAKAKLDNMPAHILKQWKEAIDEQLN
ncbi:transcriptional regulator [Polaromonas sp.]|uniref:transcriptional regulator n=1 Tax=Polaromonas sp. TaxID=1869339 RepID=UPI003561B15B